MEIILTTSEIRAILQGCQQTLRLIRSTTEYRQIERSQYFSTTNEVVLGDAIGTLNEIDEAIEEYESITQKVKV
ncbi:hypothetical protein FNW02_30735 [Komarekiella sp. 'clone 1']|uniref:Uncharacterized protein n=1 Tax=Komarekiella delphini-convector SJRDD-AB1 TaxID=2593771 RepID=A0AA40VUS6_9NOST|nr:hypothetical protein [Komarekiella delphini-convector]MBD6620056.1 hypothetical protein [Komarekiella delphini-convector SJRDD-AB1]